MNIFFKKSDFFQFRQDFVNTSTNFNKISWYKLEKATRLTRSSRKLYSSVGVESISKARNNHTKGSKIVVKIGVRNET